MFLSVIILVISNSYQHWHTCSLHFGYWDGKCPYPCNIAVTFSECVRLVVHGVETEPASYYELHLLILGNATCILVRHMLAFAINIKCNLANCTCYAHSICRRLACIDSSYLIYNGCLSGY
jgi:hypothetical protein